MPRRRARLTAGHGALAGDEEQRRSIACTHLRHTILDGRPGLERNGSVHRGLWTRSTVPSQRASTARVAHRANSVLPHGCPVSSRVNPAVSHACFTK